MQSAGECKTIAGVRETRVTATGLPWRSSPSKEEAGVVRDASGFEVKLECYDHGQLEGSLLFSGSSTPLEHGRVSASKPTFMEFGAGSGGLEALGGSVKGKITGRTKLLGFEEQELISAQ